MTVRNALLAIGLAIAAVPLLGQAAKAAQGQSSAYMRTSQLHSGGSAGSSSPTVQRRFFPGMVSRFSAGSRSTPGRHSINDVTMKRGIIGSANQLDFLSTPADAAPVRAVANVKVKEASKLRKPASAQRDVARYNRMFEMY